MNMSKALQKKIDEFAKKRLLTLTANTFPFEMIGCVEDFRKDLSRQGILTEDFEEDALTHSEKLLMEGAVYLQYPQHIAHFTARYFGATHLYVTNQGL